ncbi:MAG: hypothetical protein JWN46_3508 [Acidimicrobiales bacterium]|nr:hypothetical protein [Acidimicrobiales bacterium]
MGIEERVRALIAPLFEDTAVELDDVEHAGGILRITVDQPGGVEMGAVAQLTRRISKLLDEVDPLEGHYTLEVSSPGLERPLRTPAQFARAIGSKINVKTIAHVPGDRRFTGVLLAADDDAIRVRLEGDGSTEGAPIDERRLAYDEIERARTVFEWGPAPKPGRPGAPKPTRKKKAATP